MFQFLLSTLAICFILFQANLVNLIFLLFVHIYIKYYITLIYFQIMQNIYDFERLSAFLGYLLGKMFQIYLFARYGQQITNEVFHNWFVSLNLCELSKIIILVFKNCRRSLWCTMVHLQQKFSKDFTTRYYKKSKTVGRNCCKILFHIRWKLFKGFFFKKIYFLLIRHLWKKYIFFVYFRLCVHLRRILHYYKLLIIKINNVIKFWYVNIY